MGNGRSAVTPLNPRNRKQPQTDDKKQSQADKLVALAIGEGVGAELFHSRDEVAFARVAIDDHLETWAIRARRFRRWLAQRYFEAEGVAPNSNAVQDALSVVEGRALFAGPQHPVHVRVGERDGATYLDLADPAWRAVRIDAGGWEIVTRPPVRFRRPRGMLPLPEPRTGGTIERLWSYVNVAEDDRPLVLAWLTAAFRPSGPYCLLCLHGQQGTAKSTTARALREFVDPAVAALRSEPREVRDLMIAASNGWVCGFDNLSHIKPWLSDCLCRLATGGGFGTRQLYSDSEEMLIDVQRPLILNGIDDLVDRGDLLERSLLLALPRIEEADRRTESEFWESYGGESGALLGAILDVVAGALRELPGVQVRPLSRMADFALWGAAVERACDWAPGTFAESYRRNRESGHAVVLESEAVAPALIEWFSERSHWEGTSQQLLDELGGHAAESLRQSKRWPSTPRALSGRLRRLAPTVFSRGIALEFHREPGGSRPRLITIRRTRSQDRPIRPDRPARERSGGESDRYSSAGTRDGSTDILGTVPQPSPERDGRSVPFAVSRDGRDGRDGGGPHSRDGRRP